LGNDKVLIEEYNQILEANKQIFSKLKSDGIMEETFNHLNQNHIMN